MILLSTAISADADDAYWDALLGWNGGGTGVLTAGLESGIFNDWAGWRFQNITIPQGTTIGSATLKLKSDSAGASNCGTIRGNNVNNASVWSTGSSFSSQVTATTASTALQASGSSGTIVSHDVTAIVQEILNRAGFVSGNAIALYVNPAGATNASFWQSHETSPSDSAVLEVIYWLGSQYKRLAEDGTSRRLLETGELRLMEVQPIYQGINWTKKLLGTASDATRYKGAQGLH